MNHKLIHIAPYEVIREILACEIWNLDKFCLRNPGCWVLESVIRLKEYGIHNTQLGIQNAILSCITYMGRLGTLRCHDGDDNENVKKNKQKQNNGLNRQNNNSARASYFYVH